MIEWCGKCAVFVLFMHVHFVSAMGNSVSACGDTLSRSICNFKCASIKERDAFSKIEIRMVCISDLNGTETEFRAEERSLKRWWMNTELHGALQQQQQQQLQITKNYNTYVNRIASAYASMK